MVRTQASRLFGLVCLVAWVLGPVPDRNWP